MFTIPATDGCGWQRPGFGAGVPIPTLDLAVPVALAGTLASIALGTVGVDTTAALAADTAVAFVPGMVSVVAIAVPVLLALSADSAAAVAARELSVDSAAVVAARVVAATAAGIAEGASAPEKGYAE